MSFCWFSVSRPVFGGTPTRSPPNNSLARVEASQNDRFNRARLLPFHNIFLNQVYEYILYTPVLEGGEGAGKSTCLEALASILPADQFVLTREPGGVELAEKVRNFILHEKLTPYELFLGFELIRTIHFREKILPALKSGKHVICDRLSASTAAYQVYASNQMDLEPIFSVVDLRSREGKEVDLWIYLKIDPAIALKRQHSSGKQLDNFDQKELDFHQKVAEGYDKYFSKQNNVQIINATISKEGVRDETLSIITAFTTTQY